MFVSPRVSETSILDIPDAESTLMIAESFHLLFRFMM